MKAIILTLTLIITLASCTKENSTLLLSTSSNENGTRRDSFYLGQHYGGGVIFWLDSTNRHGLIISEVDIEDSIAWNNGDNIRTGTTDTSLGSGKKNTRAIVLAQGKAGSY